MAIPTNGFVLYVERLRVERRGSGSGTRYRTVGQYSCYMDGTLISDPDLAGATVEPRGPGDNSQTGVNNARRIEEGTYQLGTHLGSKYASNSYNKDSKPRPGIYVHDTDVRTAILVHRGIGFKASIGCINLTGSIVGPNDDIGPNTSYARMDYLIKYMKDKLSGYPNGAKRIPKAWIVVDGEP